MDVTIEPSTVAGTAQAPPSKSYTHRAILAGGYSDSATVENPLLSADTRATIRAVEAFGGDVTRDAETGALEITGFDGAPSVPDDVIDCANSGTTMRLATATAGLVDGLTVLTGDGSLRGRPQGPLLRALDQLAARAESTRENGQAPLVVGGPLMGGSAPLPGDVSSQFVTALLFAGAATDAGVNISLQTELKSAPYVDITLDLLDAFGISARRTRDGFSVGGRQRYRLRDGAYTVPGDFSSASYLLAAGAIAGEDGVTVTGVYPSQQGDEAIVDLLGAMGADIEWDREAGELDVTADRLSGIETSVADTPDLLPTLAVLGATAEGTTRLTDCEHVRYKETDRVAATADALSTMGASVEETEDELVIEGGDSTLEGATLAGRGDHRIVMALAVAGLAADGETTLTGANHVDVSFPDFFEALAGLGATLTRSE
ncbi:3-phosphoshikimate 1-carboxyvinyltransferase [Halovenus aranensis]|uniref:3-phosphoshikimate 1-carboxyvinyltransferase n=1 Tax=Halovenus aranensis TaxID=890420 RepID=A0A1G8TMZ3_9EURY|nr:3-phosphoshikimate 1-carboxyvinyltransferase [Halovenus aranensis]SDJ42966.1 3-phosphoshikimate 1-carboxyvinyltransferase [Halovenus aranensis]